MKIIKLVKTTKLLSVPLLALLTFGCGFDSDSDGGDGGVPTPVVPEDTASLAAQILDTKTSDTGELRVRFSDPITDEALEPAGSIASGLLTARILFQPDLDSSISTGDKDAAYIALYSTGTSNINLIGEIMLANGALKYRTIDPDDATDTEQYEVNNATYTEGVAIDFQMKWAPDGYSVSVDGGSTFSDIYTGPVQSALSVLSFKLGSGSGVSSYELNVDDIVVTDSTDTIVFSEDFEGFTAGTELDGSSEVFNDNSSEATVRLVEFEPEDDNSSTDVAEDFESYTLGSDIGVYEDTNGWKSHNTDGVYLIAQISNTVSYNGSQSLYLSDRADWSKPYAVKLFNAADSGSISFYAYTVSGNEDSSNIHIGDDKNNSNRFFELKISAAGAVTDNEGILLGNVALDAWHSYEISWTATEITVIIDDVAVTGLNPISTTITPEQITFITGSTDSVKNELYIDDVDSDLF